MRIRAGSLTGTIIGSATNGATTAYAEAVPYSFNDPTLTGTVTYVLTCQQVAATGNGTCGPASMTITPINPQL